MFLTMTIKRERNSMNTMNYQLLGRSGLRVSDLCLGTMTFGDDWGWGAPACAIGSTSEFPKPQAAQL
jgi:hypothetical protein